MSSRSVWGAIVGTSGIYIEFALPTLLECWIGPKHEPSVLDVEIAVTLDHCQHVIGLESSYRFVCAPGLHRVELRIRDHKSLLPTTVREALCEVFASANVDVIENVVTRLRYTGKPALGILRDPAPTLP